jgi:hypothetical protein
MRHSTLQNFCRIALLAVSIGLGLPPREAVAARICPQFLARYCVVNRAGIRSTIWTNPCFARERHLRILYAGHCKKCR